MNQPQASYPRGWTSGPSRVMCQTGMQSGVSNRTPQPTISSLKKADVDELQSTCTAKEAKQDGGLDKIKDALRTTIKANGFTAAVDHWLTPHYQYANRLAHLHFLIEHRIPARLVFIYFCGDNWCGKTLRNGKLPICPKDAKAWAAPLEMLHDHLGLGGRSKLEERVHNVFLRV